MRLLGIAVVCVLLQPLSLSAQRADHSGWTSLEQGTAVIRGRVTASENEHPLARAEVFLTGRTLNRSLVADERGRFEFTGVPAGRYQVRAASPGYLTFKYGQSTPDGSPRSIEVGRGQVHSGVDLALPRGGVIAVTVTDEFGAPMEGVWVQAQQPHFSNGRFVLGYSIDNRQNHATDDRGQIRLYDLAPGDYYVSATKGAFPPGVSEHDGPRRAQLQTFYPGAVRLADAEIVALGLGQEVGVGIAIVHTPVAQVSGHVIRRTGLCCNHTASR